MRIQGSVIVLLEMEDFESRLRDHRARRLAADEQAASDAAAKREHQHRLAQAAREKALPLVPEVYKAIAELRRLHQESYRALRYKQAEIGQIRMYAEERAWLGGFKRLEWTVGRLTIPLRGNPQVFSPSRTGQISIDEFANAGYYQWYSNSEVYGQKEETLSADHELDRVLTILAAHIASL